MRCIVNAYENTYELGESEIIYSIVSKKEAGTNESASRNPGIETPYPTSASTITVADLLDKVKETTYKNILPEDVLVKFGLERGTEDAIEGLKHSLKEYGSAYLEEEHTENQS